MAEIRAKGIIIKQSDYGEGHRMLSIFTEEYGIIKAVSYGATKTRSKSAASSQFLCYADFDLYKANNRDIMTVNAIDTLDGFYPACEDIKKLSLAVYLCDITYSILGTNNPDARMLHILLNCIYALAYKDEPPEKIKAVYELKMMCVGGYMPELTACASCGKSDIFAFDILKGGMVCHDCGGKYLVKMDKTLYKALEYITAAEDKKMLAFNASDELLKRLNSLTEQYVSLQLDTRFQSLDYYKTMLEM
ncbi:MAG: DNA repair protein RecO [Clostridia bacterium]|nr:DNA repair protein RecO [Clostridia bacterium]MBQ3461496.1 DNA repair protein RecO [Clostridia bacterium]MBQ9600152.1 DNA repair protein RecO [Clostridia bacterium]MBR0028535.1 DNA repair protein RecO [Clostridia bacterium]